MIRSVTVALLLLLPFVINAHINTHEMIDHFKRSDRWLSSFAEDVDVVLLLGDPTTTTNSFKHMIVSHGAPICSNSTTKDNVEPTTNVEPFVDRTSNVVYFDYTISSVSPNPIVNIATVYSLHNLLERTRSLKIVLIIDHKAIIGGVEYHEYLRNITDRLRSYIEDLPKESIALITSNVSSSLSDEEVIEGIANALIKFREREASTGTDKFTTILMDVLLTRNANGERERIAVYRTESKCESRNGGLHKMIVERLTFTQNVEFRLIVTEASTKSALKEVISALRQDITTLTAKIGEEITESLLVQTERLGNLTVLAKTFMNAHDELKAVGDGAANIFIRRLLAVAHTLHAPISPELLSATDDHHRYITILENLTVPHDHSSNAVHIDDWMIGLQPCIDHLNEQQAWYTFLNAIYDLYAQYDFRVSRNLYNVADPNDWGMAERAQGIHIDRDNFVTFVRKQMVALPTTTTTRPSHTQLNVLNELLEFTLKAEPIHACEDTEYGTKMIVRGDFVRFSEITLTHCGSGLRYLHVFALHTIYVDVDLVIEGKRVDVAIVAPKWYVNGMRRIVLSGANGGQVEDAARSGNSENPNGGAGSTGQAGEDSGNFMGLGEVFVNGHRLCITSKSDFTYIFQIFIHS